MIRPFIGQSHPIRGLSQPKDGQRSHSTRPLLLLERVQLGRLVARNRRWIYNRYRINRDSQKSLSTKHNFNWNSSRRGRNFFCISSESTDPETIAALVRADASTSSKHFRDNTNSVHRPQRNRPQRKPQEAIITFLLAVAVMLVYSNQSNLFEGHLMNSLGNG